MNEYCGKGFDARLPLFRRVCKRSDNKSRERFAPCFCCSGLVSAGHDLGFQHALCCGGDERVLRRCAATPHLPRLRRATCLPAGRSAGLTRHRRVIQHREPLKGKANGGTPFNTADLQGEGFGDKKKRPGALLLALFIAFWRCRSARSGTGATGRRRGLRRGRRSWENPWHRRP